MAPPPRTIELPGGDPAPLEADLEAMLGEQRGWVTFLPGVPEQEAPPPRSVLGRLLSGQGPMVPVCTWVAPDASQRPPHVEVGILHATGPRAKARLDDAGVPVPDRWVVLADHSKRGLVVAVNPEATVLESAAWLMRAGAALCRVPLTGTWRAEVHRS